MYLSMYRVKRSKHIFYMPSWFERLMLLFSTKNFEWKMTRQDAQEELNKIKMVLVNKITQNKINCVNAQCRNLEIHDEMLVILSRTKKPLVSFTLEEME